MMKEISIGAGLSQAYERQQSQLFQIQTCQISGQRNEQSLGSYNSRPSSNQLQRCSSVISTSFGEQNQPLPVVPDISKTACFTATSTSTVNTTNIPAGLFQIGNVERAQVLYFPRVFLLNKNILLQFVFVHEHVFENFSIDQFQVKPSACVLIDSLSNLIDTNQ